MAESLKTRKEFDKWHLPFSDEELINPTLAVSLFMWQCAYHVYRCCFVFYSIQGRAVGFSSFISKFICPFNLKKNTCWLSVFSVNSTKMSPLQPYG